MTKQSPIWLIFAILLLLVLTLLSFFIGVSELNLSNITQPNQLQVLLVSRFPRSFAVLLTGSSMAVAGLVMQMIVHNRFVEPTTAGTSQGAALGLLLALLLFPAWSVFGKMLFGSISAVMSMALFLFIARKIPHSDPLLLPLIGLIYGGVLGAIVTFIAYEHDMLQVIEIWLHGDFSSILRGRYELLWLSGIGALALYFLADRLTIVGMGERTSTALGVNYRWYVLLAMTMVSIITALIVITVGMIPFIGLVVPNIIRRFHGDNVRNALPWVAWTGASLLMICDILARTIRYPYEVPVNVIYGVLGAGIFLYLLIKPAKNSSLT